MAWPQLVGSESEVPKLFRSRPTWSDLRSDVRNFFGRLTFGRTLGPKPASEAVITVGRYTIYNTREALTIYRFGGEDAAKVEMRYGDIREITTITYERM